MKIRMLNDAYDFIEAMPYFGTKMYYFKPAKAFKNIRDLM